MSQRNNDRNRDRDRTRRESLSHPYWNIAHYFTEALRYASTSTLSTRQTSSSSPPSSSFPPTLSRNLSLPAAAAATTIIQPPPQNPFYSPNPIPINTPYIVYNNSILPLNFTTESINNLANIFSNYQNTESRTSNRRSSSSSSISHVTSIDEYDGIKGKGHDFSHNACTELSPITIHPSIQFNSNLNSNSFSTSSSSSSSPSPSPSSFNLNSFPYTLSTLERYEIQIRAEGKITPINMISPRQLNKLLRNCKKDHESNTNSQGNLYCKKRKNVYHYHNLNNASFYSKRKDGSSIYVNQFGDITYKTKEQEERKFFNFDGNIYC